MTSLASGLPKSWIDSPVRLADEASEELVPTTHSGDIAPTTTRMACPISEVHSKAKGIFPTLIALFKWPRRYAGGKNAVHKTMDIAPQRTLQLTQ